MVSSLVHDATMHGYLATLREDGVNSKCIMCHGHTHRGRLEAAVCLHFLLDELLLLPKITELGGQQLPMAFDPRKSDDASTTNEE